MAKGYSNSCDFLFIGTEVLAAILIALGGLCKEKNGWREMSVYSPG
jgi:hypothetical protein